MINHQILVLKDYNGIVLNVVLVISLTAITILAVSVEQQNIISQQLVTGMKGVSSLVQYSCNH